MSIREILRIMNESSYTMPPLFTQPQELMSLNQVPSMQPAQNGDGFGIQNSGGEYEDFSEQEMRLAKKFIELVGCPERATELLNKAVECGECLGMLSDEDAIQKISNVIPNYPDEPMDNNLMIDLDE
jgi:hypothetical protein